MGYDESDLILGGPLNFEDPLFQQIISEKLFQSFSLYV